MLGEPSTTYDVFLLELMQGVEKKFITPAEGLKFSQQFIVLKKELQHVIQS